MHLIDDVKAQLEQLENDIKEKMLLEIANDIKANIIERVHTHGLASDGSKIGTYSKGYMKVRTGNFKSKEIVRGKNKGKPRIKHNWSASQTDVILNLHRAQGMVGNLNSTEPIKIEDGCESRRKRKFR